MTKSERRVKQRKIKELSEQKQVKQKKTKELSEQKQKRASRLIQIGRILRVTDTKNAVVTVGAVECPTLCEKFDSCAECLDVLGKLSKEREEELVEQLKINLVKQGALRRGLKDMKADKELIVPAGIKVVK